MTEAQPPDAPGAKAAPALGTRSIAIETNTGIVNTGDQVTINLLASPLRLEEAYLSPHALWRGLNLGEQLERFTGRGWLTDEIEDFIEAEAGGWFLIQGEAGVGKTAFASVLARREGIPHHFCSLPSGAEPVRALRSIAAQLVEQEDLQKIEAPSGLPEETDTPEWFDRILSVAVQQRRERGDQRPVLLVIDALEKAESIAGMPFGLPRRLPDGVYLIATRRIGADALPLEGPVHVADLRAQLPANLADMTERVEKSAENPAIASRLAEANRSKAWFVETLLERCAGVWIYLHYVEAEIELGLREPEDLERLPPGLWAYYAETLAALREADPSRWDQEARALLVAIGVAIEPVSLPLAARFAAIEPSASQRRLLEGAWRPFLSVSAEGEEYRYAPLHATFREFARGEFGGKEEPRVDQGLVAELAETARQCERRIPELILDSWGGMDAGLPGLPTTAPRELAEPDAYGWRNLCEHLLRARRGDLLHRLLAMTEEDRSLWFAAHESAGDLEGYWRDLEAGWREIEASNDRAAANGAGGTEHWLEARYTLVAATIRTLAVKLPPSLLAWLVRAGVWPMRQALAYARRIAHPAYRYGVLQELACVEAGIPTFADRRKAFDDEIDFFDPRPTPGPDINPFSNLVGAKLAPGSEVRAELLAVAREISDPAFQLSVWASIAPILDSEELEEFALASLEVEETFVLPRLVAELAEWMEADQAERLVPAMLDAIAARGEGEDGVRLMMCACLVGRVGAQQSRGLAAEALELALDREDQDSALMALTEVVPYLPEEDQRALAAALKEREAPSVAEGYLILALAKELAVAERAGLLAPLLRIADESRVIVIANLAALLPPDELEPVLRLAGEVDGFERGVILGGIPWIPGYPYTAMGDLLGLALIAPQRFVFPSAPGIAERMPEELIGRALELALDIDSAPEMMRALEPLLKRIAPNDRRRLVEATLDDVSRVVSELSPQEVFEEETSSDLSQIVAPLIPYVGAERIPELLRLCSHLEAGSGWMLAAKICRHAGGAHHEAFGAVAVEGLRRAEAFGELHLFSCMAPFLTDAQIEAALELPIKDWKRHELVGALAARLSSKQIDVEIEREVTELMKQEDELVRFVDALLPYMSRSNLEHLLAKTLRIGDQRAMVEALVELSPSLSPDSLETLLALARTIEDWDRRATLLAALAREVDPSEALAVCEEVLDACIEGDRLRIPTVYRVGATPPLVTIFELLGEEQVDRVARALQQTIAASRRGHWSDIRSLLVKVAARVGSERLAGLERAIRRPSGNGSRDLLLNLMPWLDADAQAAALHESEGWRPEQRARLLAILPPEQALPHVESCLSGMDRADEGRVCWHLARLLEPDQVDRVVEQALARGNLGTLGPLIDRLSSAQLGAAAQSALGSYRVSPELIEGLLRRLPDNERAKLAAAVFRDGKPGRLAQDQSVAHALPYISAEERPKAIDWLLEHARDHRRKSLEEALAPFLDEHQFESLRYGRWPEEGDGPPTPQTRDRPLFFADLRAGLLYGGRSEVMKRLAQTAAIPSRVEADYPDRLASAMIEIQRCWP
ncbi:MAG TPA: hypothetical protein VFI17_07790 [Solirubrobacterales bacterium]|nr:hypothetical protein [Solirubrobacterales bacterium]